MTTTLSPDPFLPHYANAYKVPPIEVDGLSINADDRRRWFAGVVTIRTNVGTISRRCGHDHRNPTTALECARTTARHLFKAQF